MIILCSASVAIFPFDSSYAGYGLRTSGLLFDCLCRGLVCIVQKNTWGSSLLSDLGLPPELLVDFERLTRIFQEILSNLDFYQQRFRDVVPRLPQYFGPYVASNALKQLMNRSECSVVSIIIATIGVTEDLLKTLRSLDRDWGQHKLQICIQDGGTELGEIFSYQPQTSSLVISYQRDSDNGIYDALNRGSRDPRGDLLAYWVPEISFVIMPSLLSC